MAYKRFYSRPRRYYYKRGKYSRSTRAITTSRSFKASAQNMTQNSKFNINTKFVKSITIGNNESAAAVKLDLGNELVTCDMHKYLSNVFDQYKIEKCSLKFNLLVSNNLVQSGVDNNLYHVAFFSVVDRSGFANNPTLASLRTYGSYKEITWATNGDANPPHICNIGQTDLVSRSQYYDTKAKAAFPEVYVGLDVGQTLTSARTLTVTCEMDCQVRYRGVRLDTTEPSSA